MTAGMESAIAAECGSPLVTRWLLVTWGVVLQCCTATIALLDGVRTLRTPDRPNEERACDR